MNSRQKIISNIETELIKKIGKNNPNRVYPHSLKSYIGFTLITNNHVRFEFENNTDNPTIFEKTSKITNQATPKNFHFDQAEINVLLLNYKEEEIENNYLDDFNFVIFIAEKITDFKWLQYEKIDHPQDSNILGYGEIIKKTESQKYFTYKSSSGLEKIYKKSHIYLASQDVFAIFGATNQIDCLVMVISKKNFSFKMIESEWDEGLWGDGDFHRKMELVCFQCSLSIDDINFLNQKHHRKMMLPTIKTIDPFYQNQLIEKTKIQIDFSNNKSIICTDQNYYYREVQLTEKFITLNLRKWTDVQEQRFCHDMGLSFEMDKPTVVTIQKICKGNYKGKTVFFLHIISVYSKNGEVILFWDNPNTAWLKKLILKATRSSQLINTIGLPFSIVKKYKSEKGEISRQYFYNRLTEPEMVKYFSIIIQNKTRKELPTKQSVLTEIQNQVYPYFQKSI